MIVVSVLVAILAIATTLVYERHAQGAAFVSHCNADLTNCRTTVSDDKSETNARALTGVTLVDGQPPAITHQKINTLP